MTDRGVKITKSTAISLGLLIPLAGVVWWASGINEQVRANTKDIDQLSVMSKDISDIKTDVAIIKVEIKRNSRR